MRDKLHQLQAGDDAFFVHIFEILENSMHAYDELGPTKKGSVRSLGGTIIKRTYLGQVEDGVVTMRHAPEGKYLYNLECNIYNSAEDTEGISIHRPSQTFISRADAEQYIKYLSGASEKYTLRTVARMLQRRVKGKELTTEEEVLLDKLGYVALFISSNHTMEARGAIHQTYTFQGNELLNGGKLLHIHGQSSFDGRLPYIAVDYCKDYSKKHTYQWKIHSNLPYASFDVFGSVDSLYLHGNENMPLEAGDLYCSGLLIKISN